MNYCMEYHKYCDEIYMYECSKYCDSCAYCLKGEDDGDGE